ncbi:MAG: nuclear transport factor 2 family protein [Acidobacteriota bacterium]
MRAALVVALVALASPAHADPQADATKAFTTFLDSVAAKQASADVDTFVSPFSDEQAATPEHLGEVAVLIQGKPRVVAAAVAKSGTAAWIAAVVPGTLKLRASAFLTLDKGAWHVRAAELSAGVANHKPAMCGSIEPWWKPPTNLIEEVVTVSKQLDAAMDSGTAKALVPLLSSDSHAQMFGSAPGEQWTGGTAIRRIFDKWQLDLDLEKSRRSGIAPGGDLMWLALSMSSTQQCTNYRVLMVLAKEGKSWKIVHQHYAEALTR